MEKDPDYEKLRERIKDLETEVAEFKRADLSEALSNRIFVLSPISHIRDRAGNIRWIRAISTSHRLTNGEIL